MKFFSFHGFERARRLILTLNIITFLIESVPIMMEIVVLGLSCIKLLYVYYLGGGNNDQI